MPSERATCLNCGKSGTASLLDENRFCQKCHALPDRKRRKIEDTTDPDLENRAKMDIPAPVVAE